MAASGSASTPLATSTSSAASWPWWGRRPRPRTREPPEYQSAWEGVMRNVSGQEQLVAWLRQAGYLVSCDLRPFGKWRAAARANGLLSAIAYGRTPAQALALLCDTLVDVG